LEPEQLMGSIHCWAWEHWRKQVWDRFGTGSWKSNVPLGASNAEILITHSNGYFKHVYRHVWHLYLRTDSRANKFKSWLLFRILLGYDKWYLAGPHPKLHGLWMKHQHL
jgi:hypothetical protein